VRQGGRAIAVDPLYVEPPERLEEIVWQDMECLRRYATEGGAQRDLARHGDATALIDYFSVSSEYFLQDYSDNRSNYVPASLPRLPFRNGEFDLVLSSHLLFCSPTFFSLRDHAEYILELIRVARGEVRIAPLGDAMGVRYPKIAALSQLLSEQGIHVTTQQCGDAMAPNETMVLRPGQSANPTGAGPKARRPE
jgi:hypothetical protein